MSQAVPGLIPPDPSSAFPYPTLAVDLSDLVTLTLQMQHQPVTYALGAKAPSLSAPRTAIRQIDCSGFVRYALYHATSAAGHPYVLADGSVCQHDEIAARGFKHSSVDAGRLADGALRIAFLSPGDGGGVGHVVLILGGRTLESHGGLGVDRRPWTGEGWQGRCAVYCLTAPTAAAAPPSPSPAR